MLEGAAVGRPDNLERPIVSPALDRVNDASSLASGADPGLLDAVLLELGLDPAGYRHVTARPRQSLHQRVGALGLEEGAYLELLKSDQGERREALRRVAVTHTRFFRDRSLWEALAVHVLPAVVAARPLARIWSAGTASGEEVLSVALLLERLSLPGSVRLLGTDIREDLIERACRGVYPGSSLCELPPDLRARFRAEGSGFALDAAVRSRVVLAPHDLMHDPWPWDVDLLLLRNLAFTCFGDAQRERVMEGIEASLRSHSWLAIGARETLPRASAGRFEQPFPGVPLWRRRN